jgi:hypothetical protein
LRRTTFVLDRAPLSHSGIVIPMEASFMMK